MKPPSPPSHHPAAPVPPALRSWRRASVQGWVHSVETAGTVDGPGVRYVLFTGGCPLRCRYCHNPDTWHLHDAGPTTSAAVLDEIATYADFLRHAHGGVTLSGGEPLVQPEFTAAVLRGCKELGLHTALDTSGFLGSHADDFLLADTDLVLLDIKCFDAGRYHALTGGDLAPTLAFAERLAALRTPVWLRYVLVPGLTDEPGPIAGLADFAAGLGNVERVEILPFHKMGEYKWQAMNLTYQLADTEPPGAADAEAVRDLFRIRGLVAT